MSRRPLALWIAVLFAAAALAAPAAWACDQAAHAGGEQVAGCGGKCADKAEGEGCPHAKGESCADCAKHCEEGKCADCPMCADKDCGDCKAKGESCGEKKAEDAEQKT